MRVAVVSSLFPPATWAEASHAFLLTWHLANRGLHVGVVKTRGGVTPRHSRIEVFHRIRRWSWSELPGLLARLKHWSPEAILLLYGFYNYDRLPMITFLPTVARKLLPRTRFVTFFQNTDGVTDWLGDVRTEGLLAARLVGRAIQYLAGSAQVDALFGTLLRDSHRLVVVSDRARRALVSRHAGAANRTAVIPIPPLLFMSPASPPAPLERRKRLGLPPADFTIIFFGYTYPAKGVETLIRAFALVARRRRNLRLLIVGGNVPAPERPDFLQEMQALARQLAVDDKIVWAGEFPWDSDLGSRYLRAADLCVLPFDGGVCSHNSSLAAAVAHGLPVITTRGETLEGVFRDGENVIFCLPKSPGATAEAIERVMDREDLRQRLAAESLKLARRQFSWSEAVERTIAALC